MIPIPNQRFDIDLLSHTRYYVRSRPHFERESVRPLDKSEKVCYNHTKGNTVLMAVSQSEYLKALMRIQ